MWGYGAQRELWVCALLVIVWMRAESGSRTSRIWNSVACNRTRKVAGIVLLRDWIICARRTLPYPAVRNATDADALLSPLRSSPRCPPYTDPLFYKLHILCTVCGWRPDRWTILDRDAFDPEHVVWRAGIGPSVVLGQRHPSRIVHRRQYSVDRRGCDL